jgi:ribosomal protein S18 acetylase RimI-like enzyme
MYVDPGHWRRGAGEALMLTALERLSSLPYTEAVLWTFKENRRAIAFYERFGWRRDGAEKLHSRSGEPAVRYRRPVTMGPR